MILTIRHAIRYEYDKPVFLDPHTIRLTPRLDSYKNLIEHKIDVFPLYEGRVVNVEDDGSLSHVVWFEEGHQSFSVDVQMTLELADKNPYHFLVHPTQCLSLPMRYPKDMEMQLRPFITPTGATMMVRDFAQKILKEANGHTVNFLTLLNQRIKDEIVYEFRASGQPYLPDQTLTEKSGSCRDMVVLFMAAARSVGIAARFVSGYYFQLNPNQPELHAWVEVYIPGGGWRGFDPTLGMACYGHHIALTACATPDNATPVKGTFRGEAASQMKTYLEFKYQDKAKEVYKSHQKNSF